MVVFASLALACVFVPAVGAVAWLACARRGVEPALLRALLPLACLPALVLAVWPPGRVELPALLLGMRLENGVLQQSMLLLVGLAWGAAGWFAADRVAGPRPRFMALWLASLSGASLATLAGDLGTFYLGYALMTLSAYGLVVHDGSGAARRAGRVYLVMAILAEAALLAGVLLLASAHGTLELDAINATPAASSRTDRVAAVLLLSGFSVKIGVAGLHLWLPLAHPVAPVPASAILSGVVVKAGVLGLARLLAPESLPADWLPGLLALGLFTSFYGALVGIVQTRLKTVLAYSTVSQMGLVFMVAVLAVFAPAREALLPLLGLVVLHHGLNKAALFLAAGSLPLHTRWRQVLFIVPALSMAGLPLLTGALAKGGLKSALDASGPGLPATWWLSLGSLATACLLWRALTLARDGKDTEAARVHPAWPALVLLGPVVPWFWAYAHGLATLPGASSILDGIWPLMAAAGLVFAGVRTLRRWPRIDPAGRIPEGDVLVPLLALMARIRAFVLRASPRLPQLRWHSPAPLLERWISKGERALGSVSAAGLSLLLLGLALWLAWR